MVGIYCIENIINNKKYIGQSIDIKTRKRKHLKKLKNNHHENKYLQRSFNKNGNDKFIFYILEECLEEELNDKEKYWIKEKDSYNSGYNLTIGGKGIKGWKGNKKFKQHMRKITTGNQNPNYGNKWTSDMKKNLSNKLKGKYKGENNPRATSIICVENLKIYSTIQEASTDLNFKSYTSISKCLQDKRRIAGNYHFVKYNLEIYQYLLEHKFEYLCECYKNKNIFADITNEKFYYKYELKKYIYNMGNFTKREIMELLKNKEFKLNSVQYVLL